MPVVFGPFPGPRQSHIGISRDGSNSSEVSATITFLLPKERLQDLLPHPSFSWQTSDLHAYVSVSSKRLDNLDWLAGRGYNLYSIFIHGVQHRTEGGRLVKGTFLPVLWENMADPISSGREELGYPKLFAELLIERDVEKYTMTASWQGSIFSKFSLDGLVQQDNRAPLRMAPSEAGEDDGILLYRYVPAVGKRGWADTEYPVFVSYAEEAKICKTVITRHFEAKSATVSFDAMNWECLPTLHHIVARLANLPLSKIFRATLKEVSGVPDFSSAARL